MENNEYVPVTIDTSDQLETYSHPGVRNSFYKYNIHGYTNTLMRMGYDVGHITFLNSSGEYGVPFSSVVKQSKDISLYVHAIPKDIMPEINLILSMEHPSPKLKLSTKKAKFPNFQQIGSQKIEKTSRSFDIYLPKHVNQKIEEELVTIQTKLKCRCMEYYCEQICEDHEQIRVRYYI